MPARAMTAELDADELESIRSPNPVQRLIGLITASRRNMAIAAGAAGLLVIVSALAFCGGDSKKASAIAASEKTEQTEKTGSATTPPNAKATVEEPAVPVENGTGSAGSGSATEQLGPTPEELAAAAKSDEPAPTTDEPAAKTDEPAPKTDTAKPDEPAPKTDTAKIDTAKADTRPVAKTDKKVPKTTAAATTTSKKLGGKAVIVETDSQAREGKPVANAPKSDQTAIQKARSAYAAGNQKLFGGDPSSAIKLYKQALGHYPGYISSFRGLGLAYAQQGDKTKALGALRTYVNNAPTARDIPLIKKRIAALQKQK